MTNFPFFCIFLADFQVGTAAPNIPCTFTINAKIKRKGVIVSPTYPGAYPKPLFCSFLFLGVTGQRVHLEFRDFDLFSGGPQYVSRPIYIILAKPKPRWKKLPSIDDIRTDISYFMHTYARERAKLAQTRSYIAETAWERARFIWEKLSVKAHFASFN